ncbi:hypothetical protein FEM48_Zijuj04G0149900 [Ziziphus jujuba var. spinosa]|uniref:WIT1/2 N-terminal helical bundle domain-containing protein n=1 Tax=Ziziphus jujuba var. spinosa TaxID=714518 RepID=A0A978VKJ0_ZIZJJ|nr:hypothetical protein FEM48_Zijuj04G0149900 [Ziziphus jujuba var. spinosa]
MAEETQVGVEIPVTKTVEDAEGNADAIKVINGDFVAGEKEGKKEEEETAFDGEFIKVEKESLDVKDGSRTAEVASAEDNKSSVLERSSSNSSRELLEAQEKLRELEVEIERLAGVLKHSELENSQLKSEVSITKEKLEESGVKYEDLELKNKKLQEQIIEAEEKYSSQLSTLQEALQAQEVKHKELVGVKEAFDGLSLEIESSRKRMQELEQELQNSVSEAQKFEELHKQSGSHAESETKRALEFEKLLEVAKLNAKETEGQLASLQEEIKGLYEKITENAKVEEALQSTTAELSAVQEELALTKSQVLDLEQRLSSKEAFINELTQDLDQQKLSESQAKEDISALEILAASTKEELQAKVAELEEIKSKLQEEVSARELVEAALKTHEDQVSIGQEELAKVVKEKEAFEAAVADLTSHAEKLKETCSDLEEKLKVSDDNFCKADSLLSQALSNNQELEQKLKSLEELHTESGAAAATVTQKNLELEDIVRSSNAAVEEAKSQLREFETRFIEAEQKNVELEQQLNLVELKSNDAERELKEFAEKVSELNTTLGEIEEEKKQLNGQIQEYQEKITELESSLNLSKSRNSELEEELKIATGKCSEHEERASMNHQRSLELEDLIQISHSKVEGAGKKVSELELLLEAEKYRIQELEEQISTLEKKYSDAEADSKKQSDEASELASELEALQARASSLEIALQVANNKETELTESLNIAIDEKKRLEDALNSSSEKLAEAENLLEVLRNELSLTQEKLESIENDLKGSGVRENEVIEKLKIAEEQLEHQGRLIEESTARRSELELLHESLKRDSEIKLQEAVANFNTRDSEASSLSEKLKILEDQVKIYEEQVAEASQKSASFTEELEQTLKKLAGAESANEELRRQILEAENKASQSLSENELLVETNIQLKSKIDELQELLNSTLSEKEMTAQQLESHKSTIAELTDKHSRAYELHSATEARVVEADTQLQDAIQKFTQKDLEANELIETNIQLKSKIDDLQGLLNSTLSEKEMTAQQLESHKSIIAELTDKHSRAYELHSATEARVVEAETQLQDAIQRYTKKDLEANELIEKLNVLEGQLRLHEEQVHESSAISETRKVELEETYLKLKHLERTIEELQAKSAHFEKESRELAEANLKLTQEVAEYETKLSDLQTKLSTALVEKDETVEHLHTSRKTIEDLSQQLTSDGQRLQSQISSVMDENQLLNETYQNAKNELQSVILQLEGQLKENKSNEVALKSENENLKVEIAEKSLLQTRLKELEEQLVKTEARLKEEVERIQAAAAEKEAELTLQLSEHAIKVQDRNVLDEQVQQLQRDLLLAQTTIAEQKEADSSRSLEQEASKKHSLEELEAKNNKITILEKQVKEFEQKLQLADAKLTEKGDGGSAAELKDGLDVKSRDIGSTISTPSKRKSKKKLEATTAQASSSSGTQTQTAEASHLMTVKVILGVALVSVIIGIILGKRY